MYIEELENVISTYPVLMGIVIVVPFITGYEQSRLNRDCGFCYFFAFVVLGYHINEVYLS